jgi:branched-chain amino acid transport system permease protein
VPDPGQLVQLLLVGLTQGAIYALIALGFVTVYKVTGIINFAQGEFAMLGAMVTASLGAGGLPVPMAAAAGVAVAVAAGGGIERLAVQPARRAPVLALIIITIGADITLRGIALLAWGTDPLPLSAFSPGPPLAVAGAVITRQALWILGATAAALGALYAFFEGSYLGLRLRACAVNRTSARLSGISPERMSLVAFGLAGGLGGLAGIVMAPVTLASYDMGLYLGLKGFVAATMGGLTSAPGAVVGAVLLGVLEAVVAGTWRAAYKEAAAFLALFLVLLLRPHGLFTRALASRAGL